MKRINFVLLSLLLIASGCGSSETDASADAPGSRGGRGGDRGQTDQQALSVRAHLVGRKPISTYIIANTTLEAVRDVTVYSKLNSIVSDLRVEEGATVQKGQLLVRLDEREIRNEYEQAQIAIDQAEVALRQAEVKSQLSKASYERAQSLFEQKLMSREEFDQTALVSRTDALAYESAQQQIESAKSRLAAAQIQLEYTAIESPIDGVITQRLIDVGDRVNNNEALFTVLEFPPLWARIFVPERSIPQMRIGQIADLRVETYPDQEFSGRIKLISPTVDTNSGTIKITIEVNNPRALRPGMFGTVYIATETHQNAVVVPKKSLVRERDQNFVFVVQPDSRVSRRLVELGFTEEDWVEINQGLSDGETIVTVGVETLSEGYPVLVQSFEGATPENVPVPSPPPAQVAQERAPGETGFQEGAAGGREGRGAAMFERMMQDPEVKKKWEAKLKEDPSVETDPEKRRAFFRQLMSEARGSSFGQ